MRLNRNQLAALKRLNEGTIPSRGSYPGGHHTDTLRSLKRRKLACFYRTQSWLGSWWAITNEGRAELRRRGVVPDSQSLAEREPGATDSGLVVK